LKGKISFFFLFLCVTTGTGNQSINQSILGEIEFSSMTEKQEALGDGRTFL